MLLQIKFIFGYSLKLQSVVKTKGGVRTLSLPFSTPIQNALVHDLTVKVISLLACMPSTPKIEPPVLPYVHAWWGPSTQSQDLRPNQEVLASGDHSSLKAAML